MTRSTVKRLTKPLDEPEREFRRRRKAALRSHQNETLAIAGRNLFDDEASSSYNTGAKPPTVPKTLHGHSYHNSSGSNEVDECKQTNQAKQVCLSGGDIYDDPSLLRFYQNDDTPPWGNNKRKEKREDGPEQIVRSKFKDELANFMLEKKSYAKGIGDMLVQHHKELHEQYSQILSTISKSETPEHEAPTFAITTRSGISIQDPPFPAPP
ncbi:hypothetical protein Tco_1211004 [Tanacetum coccineum]